MRWSGPADGEVLADVADETAVAVAISKGAHPKAIQERMGHSSITATLDRYGHLFDRLDTQIADGLDDLLHISRGLRCRGRVRGRVLARRTRTSEQVGAEGLEPPTPSL